MKTKKKSKKEVIGDVYVEPITTFNLNNLIEKLRSAEDGTIFLLDEKYTKCHDGQYEATLTMCKVFRIKSKSNLLPDEKNSKGGKK